MIVTTLLSVGLVCAAAEPPPLADSLRAMYEGGQTWQEFYGAVRRRAATWRVNYSKGSVDPDALGRARALTGTWRILVVAVDGCSDSANTIPYLATLADSAGGTIEFRIVDMRTGRGIMEAHRTWDARAATPTLILLDGEWNEVGCWVERPTELAEWTKRERANLSDGEFVSQKTAWYDADGGRSTVSEILDMIDRAAPGAPCGGGA